MKFKMVYDNLEKCRSRDGIPWFNLFPHMTDLSDRKFSAGANGIEEGADGIWHQPVRCCAKQHRDKLMIKKWLIDDKKYELMK